MPASNRETRGWTMTDRAAAAFMAGFLIGTILLALAMVLIETSVGQRQCEKLEVQIKVNLAYTYNDGCHIAPEVPR